MEILFLPQPRLPSAGFTLAFLAHLSCGFPFLLFPLWTFMEWDRIKKFFANKLEKVKGVMRSSLGSWTPDFNNRTRFCVLIRGKLLYNVLVSAVQHCKSATYTHLPPSRPPLPPNPLGHHRARPGSRVTQQMSPATHFTHGSIYYIDATLSVLPRSFLSSLHPCFHSLCTKALGHRNTVGGC